MLKFHPGVYAVGKNYQIIITTKTESFVSVKIENNLYVDDSNGILKSSSRTHTIEVPQEVLNSSGHYTVIEKKIIKRLPYFSRTEDDIYFEYDFKPVPEDNPKCYHIADAHNEKIKTVNAALAYGKPDFLILNGDIPEDSGQISNFYTIFEIVSNITEGNIPTVFTRGNHDLRGNCAEKIVDYTPNMNGNSYYSFRLGNIWGLCLDCGEDKPDDNEEYGHTVACHQFREKETEYIKHIIENSANEYDETGVRHKIIVAHSPFTHEFEKPFDIEKDIFTEWCRLLKEFIKPEIMICGHTHKLGIYEPGCDYDTYGQPCTVVVASETEKKKHFTGTGFEFGNDEIKITFTNNRGDIVDSISMKI